MNILSLPLEINYNIMDFLDAFDILNFSKALNIRPNLKYYNTIDNKIIDYCNGNNSFYLIIKNIIRDLGLIDYDILYIFGSILHIIRKTSKYMDILGFNTYIFNLYKGTMYISRYSIPIMHCDTQIINVHYPDVETLQYYLEKYMNFVSDIHNRNTNSINYVVKNYHIKSLLKNE